MKRFTSYLYFCIIHQIAIKDEIKIFLIFKKVFELNNLELSSAQIVELDFFQDFGTGEARAFFADDLHRELVPSQFRDASLDPAETSFTENFTFECIGLVKAGSRKPEN